ncbi:hypothetical protein BDV93DRAFT_107398 [Ceratobasidium sp. AG-I]|nr:hypothetical protein BDV93DRAFT_107398 [Ceratobasidium sp. AG-I]
MWSNRAILIEEINNIMLDKPLETSAAEYQALIDEGQGWHRLLCMFKMSRFPQGLDIVIRAIKKGDDARTPATPDPPGLPAAGQESAISTQVTSPVEHLVVGNPSSPTESSQVNDAATSDGAAASTGQVVGGAEENGFDDPGTQDDIDGSIVKNASDNRINATAPIRKRKRVQAGEDSADDDEGYHPSPAELRALAQDVQSGEPADYGHRGLNASMKRLESKAKNLEREQARAMSELIEALLEVPPSQVFLNVATRLKNEIPRLTRKAMKSVKNDYEDDEEEGTAGSEPHSKRNTDPPVSETEVSWRRELVRLVGDSETEEGNAC